jgi:glycogen operon protein
VNFLASHDGYTLADVVSYEERHNEVNGEDNRDGHDNNLSRNWGAEGSTDDPRIIARRHNVRRAMLTTLLASLGTPMLVAGDEFGRTQGGNNNAYCQDNAISWLDWSMMESEEGKALFDFTARLIALRKAHPVLRAPTFLYGQDSPGFGINDIEWWDERGEKLTHDDWHNPEGRALVMRRASLLEDGRVEALTLLLNASEDAIDFTLPSPSAPRQVLIDSAQPERAPFAIGDVYKVEAHAAVLICWLGERPAI